MDYLACDKASSKRVRARNGIAQNFDNFRNGSEKKIHQSFSVISGNNVFPFNSIRRSVFATLAMFIARRWPYISAHGIDENLARLQEVSQMPLPWLFHISIGFAFSFRFFFRRFDRAQIAYQPVACLAFEFWRAIKNEKCLFKCGQMKHYSSNVSIDRFALLAFFPVWIAEKKFITVLWFRRRCYQSVWLHCERCVFHFNWFAFLFLSVVFFLACKCLWSNERTITKSSWMFVFQSMWSHRYVTTDANPSHP